MMYGIKEVDIQGLLAMQNEGECLLLDVRTDGEVAQGMIKGAQHLPLHLIPLKADDLEKEIPVVIYCRTGARSAQACAFLAGKGYQNVYNLQGGIMAWAKYGLEIAHAA